MKYDASFLVHFLESSIIHERRRGAGLILNLISANILMVPLCSLQCAYSVSFIGATTLCEDMGSVLHER